MRFTLLSLSALIVAGCATTQPELIPPRYDADAHAVLAGDYAMQRLELPDGLQLAGYLDNPNANGFVFSDQSATTLELGYLKQAMPAESRGLIADGYRADQLKDGTVQYSFGKGRYADLVDNADLIPDSAPDCAAAVSVIVSDKASPGVVVTAYLEGRGCDTLDDFGNYQRNQLKHTAYELLGLK